VIYKDSMLAGPLSQPLCPRLNSLDHGQTLAVSLQLEILVHYQMSIGISPLINQCSTHCGQSGRPSPRTYESKSLCCIVTMRS